MWLSPRVLAAVTLFVAAAEPPSTLTVLSSSPSGEAPLTAAVQVIFDRPVAGSLDRSVDPAAIFRIEPVVAGRVEWRDPVTLRFLPAAPLTPGASYVVTIANTFAAMDGSRMAEPYRYQFTVLGPSLLAGLPVSADEHPQFLRPDATFEVVYSAPLEPSALPGLGYLEFGSGCREPGVVRLRVTGQRSITEQDPWQYRQAGGWERDRTADPLRRVVALSPETPLPRGCAGELVLPSSVDPERTRPFARWAFRTYGEFRLSHATCASGAACPTGGVQVTFSTPVKGAEVERAIRLLPAVPFAVSDTSDESAAWYLEATLAPHTSYALVADSSLRDVFGQRLTGNPAVGFRTTGFAPLVEHEYGRLTVERAGFRTLAVKYVNVDTLVTVVAPVPEALIPAILKYNRWNRDDSALAVVLRGGVTKRLPVRGPKDKVRIYGVPLPGYTANRPNTPLLQVVRVTSPSLPAEWQEHQPYAIVQVTDLAVHARIGYGGGVVWVTGVSDGKPRPGALVALHDPNGKRRATARTGRDGLAVFGALTTDSAVVAGDTFEGYVIATLAGDRALTSISTWDPDLSPWRFNVRSGWGAERWPAAAAVFTERGIYRPGETVQAKAIVRSGLLGQLQVPARGDSLRWVFDDRDGGNLLRVTTALTAFGTSAQSLTLRDGLPLGTYLVRVQQRRAGEWLDLASTSYRVAEYRPPEFLVDASADSGARYPGDTAVARFEARYLFGAPMARAVMTWSARQTLLSPWEISIPGSEGYYLGEGVNWWEEGSGGGGEWQALGSGEDTLDARGRVVIRVPLADPGKGRPAQATVEGAVSDVNRQVVGARASLIMHPASFYIGAKPVGEAYFWSAGTPQRVEVVALRPDGRRVAGAHIAGTVVRREWHRVHRTRAGYSEVYGEWVSDTVARCRITTGAGGAGECRFTPPAGGSYVVGFTAADEKGRPVATSFYRWATGKDWVPWNDETQFKMDLIADRQRYSVGDTATVLFASPFTDAEAWVTVEREGLIEQRRLKLTAGSTTLKFPVTEAWTPNALVSVIVARGRSAPPGPLDDPGRPTLRVGYVDLRVTPEVKRLAVKVEPLKPEYRPGDTARVRLAVVDGAGRGQRSEVTLWAVDEGVLALTGYATPDPIDLLYAPRGLGLRLASNLTTVAPQVPEGEKGNRNPGGGGGQGEGDLLRSRFRTTAFFLASVVTDSAGRAVAAARLPDNLTTFRVMAVAVTAGDRYGSGAAKLLVTRPLLARPALPRFVRESDRFEAGVVVNQRAGGTPTVSVSAAARGARLVGDSSRVVTLEAGRGREVRFGFQQPGTGPLGADSAAFRFGVRGAGDADLVEQRVAVLPAFRPRAWTITGVLADTASVLFPLPEGIDPERSRLELSLGSSPLGLIKGFAAEMRVYSYYCTEQVSSTVRPIIALYRAQRSLRGVTLLKGDPRREIESAVALLVRRQRPDGGIGYWNSDNWTTPWLSAEAGHTLLEARAAGVAVSDSALARLAEYLRVQLRQSAPIRAPVVGWYDVVQARLGDQVAAADYLSRFGKPEIAAENELLRNAAQLAWEDRLRLAEVLARRKASRAARTLLEPAWASVRVEGRRAVVPEEAYRHRVHFFSRVRPAARLLTATLAVDSAHVLLGPLVETVAQQARAGVLDPWNTQDYAAAVGALAAFDARLRSGGPRGFSVRQGTRVLLSAVAGPATGPSLLLRDSVVALTDLLGPVQEGERALALALSGTGPGAPLYYYLTVREVPRERPVRPTIEGIQLERWYERYDRAEPLTSVAEGELVRVRLRITVPSDRQFVVVDDALPAGLEAVDLSLRTASALPGPGQAERMNFLQPDEVEDEGAEGAPAGAEWFFGSWDAGWWSPFDYAEIRADRVVYFATVLWKGTYSMTYVARATTPGTFVRPPAHAEEMYNPAVHGRSDGGVFTVTPK
jgi:hypothetical protein